MSNPEPTTLKSLKTSVCTMDLKSGNLVYIHLFEDASIEIPEVEELQNNLNSLVNNQLHYLIVFSADGNTSSHQARKYAAELKGKNVVAEALIVNNLAIRILANFYVKVNRPRQKIKIFSDASLALEWINTFRIDTKAKTNKAVCL